MTVTAIDRAVRKTEAVSLIGPDGGQVLTAHDENKGLGPQVSRADQQIMTARTSMLTIGEPIADFRGARLLEPIKWRTEIKGYSTFFVLRSFCGWIQRQIIRRPKIRIKVGETFGSSAHCPMDKKLLSEKSKHITPGDDSWLARLLRRRLEQDVHEAPPEWITWFHGFNWEEMSLFEKAEIFTWRDGDGVLHTERRLAEPVRDAVWRPKNTNRKTKQKSNVFFDEWLPDSPLVVKHPDGTTSRVALTIPTAKRFRGQLKSAAATWAYIHEDERIAKRHGIGRWVSSQRKPALNQAERIERGKELKNLHRDEELAMDRARELKSKGNTGGWQPLRAQDDSCDWRMEEQRREPRFVDEADSPTEMIWDGDGFTLVDDKPEYFACQIKSRGRGRGKTNAERLEKRESWEVTRARCEAILKAGKAWSPLDPREDDRVMPNGVKYNRSNKRFKRIQYEIELNWENFDSRKKLYAELGLEWETERKKELEEINMRKECPTTKFTAAQIKDIVAHDGRVAYVYAVTDKPRWYKLDMDRFETYQEAIEDVKRRGKDKALKETKMWMNERAPKAKHAQALKEVVVRWEEYFRKEVIYIADWRTPLVVAIAEMAWESDHE